LLVLAAAVTTDLFLPMQTPASPQAASRMIPFESIAWRGPASGLQTAVVEGNPQASGPFTMLLRLPDGVWIPPHFHNVEKRLIVIKGELLMGHGDAIESSRARPLGAGSVAVVPAQSHHYEGGRQETIVALIANGPFTTTMVGSSPPR
jgi:mannose-6-phosphate isomerase-like protein (cupin superfamily)